MSGDLTESQTSTNTAAGTDPLLDELKLVLDVTWEDTDTDQKLAGILARAKAQMDEYAGAQLTYTTESTEKQLLFDLCRYIWNNAAEEFEQNFRSKLIALNAKYAVEAMNSASDE